MTSMHCKPKPAIWSRDTGERILDFDWCQLTITWMSNIKDLRRRPRLGISNTVSLLARARAQRKKFPSS